MAETSTETRGVFYCWNEHQCGECGVMAYSEDKEREPWRGPSFCPKCGARHESREFHFGPVPPPAFWMVQACHTREQARRRDGGASRTTTLPQRKRFSPAVMASSTRYKVLRRDGYRCCLCGRGAADGVKLHVDHRVPQSRGGTDDLGNLRTLCVDCNLGKGVQDE